MKDRESNLNHHSDIFEDENTPQEISMEDATELLDTMVKEIFLETFERAFGVLDDSTLERVATSHLWEVKQWIPNCVDARNQSDVFVSPLERSLAQYAAGVINRKHGGDFNLEEVKQLRDVEDRLESMNGVDMQKTGDA